MEDFIENVKAQCVSIQEKQPSKLKGRKIEPKYRGPNGETWSGRGKLPKFIKDSGQDKEQFRIK